MRENARKRLINFHEIYVKCPIEICMQRDPKGLYKKRQIGEESNVIGIDIPYEEPERPEIIVDTCRDSVDICADRILNYIDHLKGVD